MMGDMVGARVRIRLVGGTVVEGRVARQHQPVDGWNIEGVGYVGPIDSVTVLEPPRPKDLYADGAVLYAENNGFHHVWVKSGGDWYTANRSGARTWNDVLTQCVRWKMPLKLLSKFAPIVYDPS